MSITKNHRSVKPRALLQITFVPREKEGLATKQTEAGGRNATSLGVIALHPDLVKVRRRKRLQDHGHLAQAFACHEKRTQLQRQPIPWRGILPAVPREARVDGCPVEIRTTLSTSGRVMTLIEHAIRALRFKECHTETYR
jgi:hypothetical protein